MKKLTIGALVTAAAVAAAAPLACAQPGGYGPGMMGGYGGYGMGPGMMGGGYGYSMGSGMMDGGYGMGPGMMGGYGGYGMGPGMMGGYGPNGAGALNLTDDQRQKMTKIQEDLATKHWALMGKMQEQQYKLRDLVASGKADDASVGKAYKGVEELRQQMWATAADARTQMDAVLTPSQRDELRRGWRRDAK